MGLLINRHDLPSLSPSGLYCKVDSMQFHMNSCNLKIIARSLQYNGVNFQLANSMELELSSAAKPQQFSFEKQ